MKKHLWKVMGLVALLALVVGAVPLAAQDAEPAGPINSLRVYGEGTEVWAPYKDYTGPFDLTSDEAPHKDFVVFNPAIFLDQYDPLARFIKANGRDVGQKVHARMWYDPSRPEPAGDTWPEVSDPDTFADIVFEYTYTLIGQDHEPTTGGSWDNGQITQMAFPMAGLGGPLGLDRFDVGPYEGINEPVQPAADEVMRLEAVTGARGLNPWGGTTDSTIVVSPQATAGGIRLEKGQWLEFFDYAVKVIDEPTSQEMKVEVAIYYTGYGKDDLYYVGSTNLWMYDKAAVDARFGPVRESWSQEFWMTPEPVTRPFWVEATHVGTDYVSLKPYRYLQTGETFFVDGAEYDVAAIYTEGDDPCRECDRELKYITIQSPLPKGDGSDIYIKDISVYKRTVRKNTSLPMLPPFNMVHDEVDDTNIPNCVSGPDVQNPDNDNSSPCKDPDYLDPRYDLIAERLMLDTPPYDGEAGDPWSYIAWIDQTKEDRFDTNLMEEKFSEPDPETWQWINIETNPMSYTEFILPLRPDKPVAPYDRGDYILVGSWLTEDSEYDENGELEKPVRMKFVYDAAVGKIDSADIYVNDAEYNAEFFQVAENSLRVYGRDGVNAAFPYERFDGPFNLGNENMEKPGKDFIVHNPALLSHFDREAFGGLYSRIKADEDAHEKVHLRTWYVPEYDEPAGPIWDDVDPDPQYQNPDGDIVNEYTYILLDDDTFNPTHGSKDRTDMVFPIASGCGLGVDNPQVGLDRYDVNNDGTAELMSIEYIQQDEDWDGGWTACSPVSATTNGEIVVSAKGLDAGNMKLSEGGRLEFFDYMVKLVDTSTSQLKADLEVYYTGEQYDQPFYLGNITLWQEAANAAVVDAGQWDVFVSFDRHFETIPLESAWPGEGMVAVDRPFGFLLTYVGDDYVSLKPYRILRTGETFFVDGAEYDVAAIGIVPGDQPSAHLDCDLAELKYITIRNPIPKGTGEFFLPEYTTWKARFGDQDILPVLPPFNHEHDIVDDVNVPEDGSGPDAQAPDNLAGDDVDEAYRTILDRHVEDVDPLEFYWLREEKETRFDTSLTEEKWKYTTDSPGADEKWHWINIETMPWHFTEFVLPEIPQAEIGNYLLVSSFVTQDDVRVKFAYDPTDGTGLYVNSDLCEPARVLSVTSNSPVQQYATVELFGVVNEHTEDFEWDFGDLTGCTGEDTLEPTCSGNVAGEFEVTLTAINECGEHTVPTTVVVEACPGDFCAPWGFRDLADIMAMLPAWNTGCGDEAYEARFDFNDDCHIGLFDIMQVVAVWNTECPGGTP